MAVLIELMLNGMKVSRQSNNRRSAAEQNSAVAVCFVEFLRLPWTKTDGQDLQTSNM